MYQKKSLPNFKSYLFTILNASFVLFFFSGCAFITGYKDQLNSFDYQLLTNKCNYEELDKRIQNNDNTILWSIQGGSLARNCMDYTKSNQMFDNAETNFKIKDEENNLSKVASTGKTILVNNNINDYEGYTYEKIMLNTYKALNFASLGDFTNARVEFNRALDRQRRAKEEFESEIKKQQEKIKNQEQEFRNQQKQQTYYANRNLQKTNYNSPMQILNNKHTQEIISKEYSTEFANFKAYPDFVNPFTTYISGLFFILNNDVIKGRDLLKEAYIMQPNNQQIKQDYLLSEELIKRKNSNSYIWVIYENGTSFKLNEKIINIPLFIVTNKVFYSGFSYPYLVKQNESYKFLNVNGQKTTLISDMNSVIKTEFQIRFINNIIQTIMSNIFKTYAQYELNSSGPIGGILGVLYQSLTNKADVRSWTALPENFQSTRIINNGEPIVIKNDKNGIIQTINIKENQNAIIYIRSQVPSNNSIHTILF